MSDPRQQFRHRAAQLLRPRALADIVDWLPANVRICDAESDYRGPFTFENCPDLREIARSCVSPHVETTVIIGPTQSFKSTLLTGVAAYTIAVDPGPIGWVFGTTDIARAFSQKRIQPTVAGSPTLAAQIPEDPDAYKTLELGFRTCTVRLAGSNSPSNVATFSYKRVIGDEVDKYPATMGDEAGTLDLLLLRTDQYTHHNHIFASSPTVREGTIWRAALQGDCRRYHVPCPHCAKPFVFEFEQLKWDPRAKSRLGTWDFARVAATAHYQCPHCQNEIWENHRRDMLHAGNWLPDSVERSDLRRSEFDPVLIRDPKRRSYFRSCFNVIHPNRTFAALAEKHLVAGHDPSARQNFTNGQLGEVYEPKAVRLDWQNLWDRREPYLDGDAPDHAAAPFPVTLPEQVLVLAAAVDAQENPPRLELEIRGYGEGDESWGIQYKIIDGDPYDLATWLRLDEFLLYAWAHPHGHVLRPAITCIDTGYATDIAYAYVARCQPRRVLAVKGSSGGYGEPLIDRPRKSGVDRIALWLVGTVTAKELIYARLRLQDDGPGKYHFPRNPKRGYDQTYFRGLTAEKIISKYERGRKVIKFVPGSFRRNEPLDINCYMLAGLDVLRPDYKGILRRHADQPELNLQSTHENEKAETSDRRASVSQTPLLNPASVADRTSDHSGGSPDSHFEYGAQDSRTSSVSTFDPATGKIEKPIVEAEGRASVLLPPPSDVVTPIPLTPPLSAPTAESSADIPLAPIVTLPAAPTQKPRPAPNLTLPHKFRQRPRRGTGFVTAWKKR